VEIRVKDYILQLNRNQPLKISKDQRICADGMDIIVLIGIPAVYKLE